MRKKTCLALAVSIFLASPLLLGGENCHTLELNGIWEYGLDRNYTASTSVPGITLNPEEITPGTLWYRRSVTLPEGNWDSAVLELKGARFRPTVYVDGVKLSSCEGGMVRTLHPLAGAISSDTISGSAVSGGTISSDTISAGAVSGGAVPGSLVPGKTVTLEIALASLGDVPSEDASCIPAVDQWRSNCSSCLWDDVVLHLYKGAYVDRVLTFPDLGRKKAVLRYRVNGTGAAKARISINDIITLDDIITLEGPAADGENEVTVSYRGKLELWTPENPNCYTLKVELLDKEGNVLSEHSQNFGLKTFDSKNKRFRLNGKPCRVRGGSIVWHRWVRDDDAREINYDTTWYNNNVISRIKERGGIYLRFHLGLPPERILDLCDRKGLLVQYEWNFFHGAPASLESMRDQYAKWMDMASRHPSIAIYHPYNETSPEELTRVWTALDSISAVHPPVLFEERDINHLHRYWWGMFENLGLYYDSYKQFIQPIMVDEFGGYYLDKDGNVGSYPMLAGATKRWFGSGSTTKERLYHQTLGTGKVGEYWRRLGAAGIGAFAIASSSEDGNNYYMGDLREGNLKPIWNSLTPVWAPRVVSMDIWKRNFAPGSKQKVPLHFINDSDRLSRLKARLQILDADGNEVYGRNISRLVFSHCKRIARVKLTMPQAPGKYTIKCTLLDAEPYIKAEVASAWDVWVVKTEVPSRLASSKVYIPAEEKELLAMARSKALTMVGDITDADIVLTGRETWNKLGQYRDALDEAIKRGTGVVMLDIGEMYLGKQYNDDQKNLGAVLRPTETDTQVKSDSLFAGLFVNSTITYEGESHIHPYGDDDRLWYKLDKYNTRLWNGLRGGLIVPSVFLDVQGLSQEAFMNQWIAKGADPKKIKTGPYYAYDHCGFIEYSDRGDDESIKKKLKDKVFFLIQDMPALELSLDKDAPVAVTDLHAGYEKNAGGRAREYMPLVSAGQKLVRTPVMKILFGEGEGNLILSQLITEGRMAEGFAPKRKAYSLEQDEAAVQFVLNMMESVLPKN